MVDLKQEERKPCSFLTSLDKLIEIKSLCKIKNNTRLAPGLAMEAYF